MRFLDRLFGKRRQPELDGDKVSESVGECLKVDDRMNPDIVGELSVGGNEYLIREFEIDFMQDIGLGNRPDGKVYGGFMMLTLLEQPDIIIREWAISSRKEYDGEVRFYKNGTQYAENSLMNIVFRKANCTHYKKEFDVLQGKDLTTLCICPHLVKIGREEFE